MVLFRFREETLSTYRVWAIAEGECIAVNCSMISFYRLGVFIC